MKQPSRWANTLIVIAAVYSALLLGWAALGGRGEDRSPGLFVLNSFAPFLFAPLPFIGLAAWRLRRRELALIAGVLGLLWLWLYGGLWLPATPPVSAREASLTVMTYNLYGGNEQAAPVVAAIRAAHADLVALQELNPTMAALLARDLVAEYPYQVLAPQWGTQGMGVISRYPLQPSALTLAGVWSMPPQVLTVATPAAEVLLLHVHFHPTTALGRAALESSTALRAQQVQAVRDVADGYSGPLLVVGDMNMTERSRDYHLLAHVLTDAWRSAGWGFGLTFPARAAYPGVLRGLGPRLVRIDYVWHSAHFSTATAQLGPESAASDHCPVVATLVWQ